MAGIIYYANPALFIKNISQANIYFVTAAFLAATAAFLLKVLKWQVLVSQPFFTVLHAQAIGNAASSFMPFKSAEPLKPVLLKMMKGIDVSKTFPSVIYERALEMLVVAAFSVYAFALLSSSNFLFLSIIGLFVMLLLMAVLFALFYSRRLGSALFVLFNKIPIPLKLSESFVSTFYSIKIRKKSVALCFILTALSWLLEGLALYLAAASLGVSISLAAASAFICLASILGIVSFLPGGIGSFEAALSVMIFYTGVPYALSVTLVMLYRFTSFWYMVAIGGASFVYLSRKLDIRNAMKSLKF